MLSRTRRILLWSGIAITTSSVFVGELGAQSIFATAHRRPMVTFEVTKHDFDGLSAFSSATNTSTIGVRLPIGTSVMFVADFPMALLDDDGFDAEAAIGNPFLGLEFDLGSPNAKVAIGGRLPTAPEGNSATIVGVYDVLDRLSAWNPYAAPLRAMLTLQQHDESTGLVARVSAGPEIWFPVRGSVNHEVFAVYNAQAGYEMQSIAVTLGVGGLMSLDSDDGSLGERSLHQAVAAINLTSGRVRPGLHFRLPLDKDLMDTVDYAVGFNLAVLMP